MLTRYVCPSVVAVPAIAIQFITNEVTVKAKPAVANIIAATRQVVLVAFLPLSLL